MTIISRYARKIGQDGRAFAEWHSWIVSFPDPFLHTLESREGCEVRVLVASCTLTLNDEAIATNHKLWFVF